MASRALRRTGTGVVHKHRKRAASNVSRQGRYARERAGFPPKPPLERRPDKSACQGSGQSGEHFFPVSGYVCLIRCVRSLGFEQRKHVDATNGIQGCCRGICSATRRFGGSSIMHHGITESRRQGGAEGEGCPCG